MKDREYLALQGTLKIGAVGRGALMAMIPACARDSLRLSKGDKVRYYVTPFGLLLSPSPLSRADLLMLIDHNPDPNP